MDFVKFSIYAHGNITRGNLGPEYDRDPIKLLKMETNATFDKLFGKICKSIGIDPSTSSVEILYRHPNAYLGIISYSLIPVRDDDDVKNLFEMTEAFGQTYIHHLFVRIPKEEIGGSPMQCTFEENTSFYATPSAQPMMVDHPMVDEHTIAHIWKDESIFDETVGPLLQKGASYDPVLSCMGDDFYDGIPCYTMQKSTPVRSKQAAVAKVSRLGRGAYVVLDTLRSSVSSLNLNSGFASGVATKGNELAILSFEIANTINKGSNLMQSLSQRSIRHLKETVLPSVGVQELISKDMDELLRLVAADKREELKIFSGEVIRFGNRCKDPQWHNLHRYFEKITRKLTPQKKLREEAETVMIHLMTLVHHTVELYHELHPLGRFEQDYHRKRLAADISSATQKGDGLSILRAELKSQRKEVKSLKKKSLWLHSLEEVVEKLVDIVHFLLLETHNTFGPADTLVPANTSTGSQKLGPAGLSLHYANIIIQIDTLVARSSSVPPNMRDSLYQSLPPSIKSSLRSKLWSFHVKEEMSIPDIKAEMEKTLQWLVPVAMNTAKVRHGFGWVGEWANTGSEGNRKPATGPLGVICIETLHHADKEKTEAYILEQLLWLHHLASQAKNSSSNGGIKLPINSPNSIPLQQLSWATKSAHPNSVPTILTAEDHEMLQRLSDKKRVLRISKSQDFDSSNIKLKRHDRLNKSGS